MIVGARREAPLVIGVGDGRAASSPPRPGVPAETRQLHAVEDGEIVDGHPRRVRFDAPARRPREPQEVTGRRSRRKGRLPDFMLKEIHEQPHAVADTLAAGSRRPHALADIGDSTPSSRTSGAIVHHRLRHLASRRAGRPLRDRALGARPVEVDIASEFRYRDPCRRRATSWSASAQSGETADTLAAIRLAREQGATVLAIANVVGSRSPRDADASSTRAPGPRSASPRPRPSPRRSPRSPARGQTGAVARHARRRGCAA